MKKILIIEDDNPVRENIVELLTAEGYEVAEAEDGESGVAEAWEFEPDLILCDIAMPKLDGYGVLARLRQDRLSVHIPFIFLTARVERGDLRRGMEMGADDYITKPFTRQEILQAIQTRFHKAELLQSHVIRQYSDLRSRMNQIIPHELLSPLSVITGLSGLLLQRDAEITEDQVQTIARDIQKSGEKLSYLLQQYIEYSELEGMWQEPEKIQQFRQSRLQDAGRRTEEIVSKIAELYHREKDLSLACENVSIAITGFHFEKVIEDVAELIFHYSPPGSDVKVMVHLCQNTHMACIEFMSRSLGFFDRDIVDDSGHSTMNISILIVKFLVEMYNGRMESIKEETGYLKTCLYFPPAN